MKYKIDLTDDDYFRFNLFYANHSKAGKRSMKMARIVLPVLALSFLLVLFLAGARPGLLATEAVVLAVVVIVWYLRVPKIMERNIRKNIDRIKADGKLPYHAASEIAFEDTMIVEKNEMGEFHVAYSDIETIYPGEAYLYIFYGAIQAFIIPYRCLGKDTRQVVEYVLKKQADSES